MAPGINIFILFTIIGALAHASAQPLIDHDLIGQAEHPIDHHEDEAYCGPPGSPVGLVSSTHMSLLTRL